MTVVNTYHISGNRMEEGMLRASVKTKSGELRELAIDVVGFKKVLAESGGIGILSIRLPRHERETLVAVCGMHVNPADGVMTKVALREVTRLERVQVRLKVEVEELPRLAKAGKAILVQRSQGPAVQATVLTIQKGVGINLSFATIGDSIRARDLPLPEGMRLLSDPDEVIFRVEGLPGRPEVI